MVKTVNNTNFNSILNKSGVSVIDFWAEWCGPCKMLTPIINNVATKNSDILIGKVNIDDNSELSIKYGIRNIPTLLFIKNGEVVNKLVGVKSEIEIQRIINSIK